MIIWWETVVRSVFGVKRIVFFSFVVITTYSQLWIYKKIEYINISSKNPLPTLHSNNNAYYIKYKTHTSQQLRRYTFLRVRLRNQRFLPHPQKTGRRYGYVFNFIQNNSRKGLQKTVVVAGGVCLPKRNDGHCVSRRPFLTFVVITTYNHWCIYEILSPKPHTVYKNIFALYVPQKVASGRNYRLYPTVRKRNLWFRFWAREG